MNRKFLLLILLLIPPAAFAAVSEKEAEKLGQDLTPVGAIQSGNKEGTIPTWNGGITTPPADYQPGDHHPDPYADDDLLFTITAENAANYKDKLSVGHQELLKKYPDFKMNVYPTRRSAAYPDYFYKATKKNAVSATLIKGGDSVSNTIIGIPFPIPKNGHEVIWNHLLRYRAETVRRYITEAVVYPDGKHKSVRFIDQTLFSYSKKSATIEGLNNIIGTFKQQFTAPARLAGTILLVHETFNQVKEPRHSWIYNPGQRRVRRAPFIGYDFPSQATDGLRLIEEFDMFTGATDRFNWTLIGRKELYVPYNAYKLHGDQVKHDQIMTPRVINSDLARYELHRVWVVEAALKKGKRHIHPKRIFYFDEDSWQLLMVDNYNKNGQLWRISEGHPINYYEVPTVWTTVEAHYDLFSERYVILGLNNEDLMYKFNISLDRGDFTPAAIRRDGMR